MRLRSCSTRRWRKTPTSSANSSKPKSSRSCSSPRWCNTIPSAPLTCMGSQPSQTDFWRAVRLQGLPLHRRNISSKCPPYYSSCWIPTRNSSSSLISRHTLSSPEALYLLSTTWSTTKTSQLLTWWAPSRPPPLTSRISPIIIIMRPHPNVITTPPSTDRTCLRSSSNSWPSTARWAPLRISCIMPTALTQPRQHTAARSHPLPPRLRAPNLLTTTVSKSLLPPLPRRQSEQTKLSNLELPPFFEGGTH